MSLKDAAQEGLELGDIISQEYTLSVRDGEIEGEPPRAVKVRACPSQARPSSPP